MGGGKWQEAEKSSQRRDNGLVSVTVALPLYAYGKFFTDKIVNYLYLAFVKRGCLFTQIFHYVMIQFI